MSMIFHHFDNPALAARECRRVLRDDRDGATAFLRTGTRERISSYPYVDFFPESRPILEEVLPTNTFVREVFEAAGFRMVTSGARYSGDCAELRGLRRETGGGSGLSPG